MRLRLFIAFLMLGTPLLAAEPLGYYATGYEAIGFDNVNAPVVADSSTAQSASAQVSTEPSTTSSSPSFFSSLFSGGPSADDGNGEKNWAASFAFAFPFYYQSDFWGYANGFAFDLSLKRFISVPVRNLSVPVEVEISIACYDGEFDGGYRYDDYYSWITLDIYSNVLARYNLFSFFYVEGGIEWGFNIITDPGESFYEPSLLRLGLPLGFGFRIANTVELGERVVFTTDRYTRYEVLSVAILF